MLFRLLFVLLLLPLVSFGQLYTAGDTANWNDADLQVNQANAATLFVDFGDFAITDSISIYNSGTSFWHESIPCNKSHDLNKEYITKIEETCDTSWLYIPVPVMKHNGVQLYDKKEAIDDVKCKIDTTWAKKELFYLTPAEVKKLKTLLENVGD